MWDFGTRDGITVSNNRHIDPRLLQPYAVKDDIKVQRDPSDQKS